MSEEKLEMKTGDEIRIICKGDGRFLAQFEGNPKNGKNVVILPPAAPTSIQEIAAYLTRVLG